MVIRSGARESGVPAQEKPRAGTPSGSALTGTAGRTAGSRHMTLGRPGEPRPQAHSVHNQKSVPTSTTPAETGRDNQAQRHSVTMTLRSDILVSQVVHALFTCHDRHAVDLGNYPHEMEARHQLPASAGRASRLRHVIRLIRHAGKYLRLPYFFLTVGGNGGTGTHYPASRGPVRARRALRLAGTVFAATPPNLTFDQQ